MKYYKSVLAAVAVSTLAVPAAANSSSFVSSTSFTGNDGSQFVSVTTSTSGNGTAFGTASTADLSVSSGNLNTTGEAISFSSLFNDFLAKLGFTRTNTWTFF